jgi:hypothetical protein
VTRGKQNELDRYQAGTMTVVLDNDDRTFDPTYADSPLNGHILPMKRVKLTATWAGVTYPLFGGYADRWTQNREGPRRGTTSLQATDALKVLGRAGLPSSPFVLEVQADGPAHWWRLGDPDGASIAQDSAGGLDLTVSGVTFDEDGLISREADTCARWEEPTDRVYGTISDVAVGASVFTMECVVRVSTLPSDFTTIMGFKRNVGNFSLINVAGTSGGVFAGFLEFAMVASDGLDVVVAEEGSSINDGGTHHIAGTYDTGTITLYLDGVEIGSDSGTAGTLAGPLTFEIGNQDSTWGFPGWIDEVAVYDSVLPAARIAAHAEAVRTPWNGDLPGERINRILDFIGWPEELRDVDDGVTTLQSASFE